MKPWYHNIFIYLFVLCIAAAQSFSQDSITVKNQRDSILKSYQNKFRGEKSHSTDALFLSFKGGYHYSMPDYETGLNGSWLVNLSFGAMMNDHWIIGFDYDYWKTTMSNFQSPITKSRYELFYNGKGGCFFFKFRVPFLKNAFDLDIGLGIGGYRISSNSREGNFSEAGYLNFSPRFGLNVKVFDFAISGKKLSLKISSEAAYYSLLSIRENATGYKSWNFKLGPSLNLYY